MSNTIIDLKELVKSANLQSRVKRFISPNHGSSTGESVNIIQYWDPYKNEWTVKSVALQGYIFNEVHEILSNEKLLY